MIPAQNGAEPDRTVAIAAPRIRTASPRIAGKSRRPRDVSLAEIDSARPLWGRPRDEAKKNHAAAPPIAAASSAQRHWPTSRNHRGSGPPPIPPPKPPIPPPMGVASDH